MEKKRVGEEEIILWVAGAGRLTLGAPDADGELAGARPARLDDEAALVQREQPVLDARPVHAHLAGVRRTRHAQREGTSCSGTSRSEVTWRADAVSAFRGTYSKYRNRRTVR